MRAVGKQYLDGLCRVPYHEGTEDRACLEPYHPLALQIKVLASFEATISSELAFAAIVAEERDSLRNSACEEVRQHLH